MSKKIYERLFSLVVIFSALFFYYNKIILSPNSFISSDTGDGIMNNTTVAGHVKNDTDYTNFRNMNYPYGQMHIYTAGQTFFAQALRFAASVNPWFVTHCMGVINIIMLLSFIACAFVLCLILQKLNLSSFFIIFGSAGITMLSPQIFRMQGHPELCYAVCIPLSWWLLIKYFESNKKLLYSLMMMVNSIFWFFVCPYFIMIIAVFYTAYYGTILIQRKNYFKGHPKRVLYTFLQIGLPLIISRIYLALTDIHEFRPQHPWGFNEFYATLSSVFAPLGPPLESFFKLFFNLEDRRWEGWAYVGFPSVIIAVYSVFRLIRYSIRKKFTLIINPVLPPILQTTVIAVIPILIFSMCMPFRLFPNFFFGHLGFLEQFRSLGRFAWIFYIVFTVYSVYISYLIFRKFNMKGKRIVGFAWSIFLFAFFLIESYPYHKSNAESISNTKNVFNAKFLDTDYREVISRIEQIKENFQCIIPLPFYHEGTDNFGKPFTDKAIKSSMVISYWTNVPLLASSTARTPLLEAKKIMQFFSPPFFKKDIEEDLPNRKPFLILYTKENLVPQEEYYFSRSLKIFENNAFVLSELPYDAVFKNNSGLEISHFSQIRNALTEKNGFLMRDTSKSFFYDGFDNTKPENIYKGIGALKGVKRDYTILAKEIQLHLDPTKEYIVSYWFFNKDETSTQTDGIIEEKSPHGNTEWNVFIRPIESLIIDGNWSLVEKKFRPKYKDELISVLLSGNGYSKLELFVDELMIREAEMDVYKIVSLDSQENITGLMKNNIYIK